MTIKPFIIDPDSFSYKLISKLYVRVPTGNFCQYWWAFVWTSLFFLLLGTVAFLGCIFAFLGCIFAFLLMLDVSAGLLLSASAFCFTVMAMLAVLICAFVVCSLMFYCSDKIKKVRKDKSDNIVVTYIKAKKAKYCPPVIVENTEKKEKKGFSFF